MELVSEEALSSSSFEDILAGRIMKFKEVDYKEIADKPDLRISSKDKCRYARIVKGILLKGQKTSMKRQARNEKKCRRLRIQIL